jgi:hypothetical protein
MDTKRKMGWLTGLTLIFSVSFNACDKLSTNELSNNELAVLEVKTEGTSTLSEPAFKLLTSNEQVAVNTDEELLLYMVEEEKLARDVYYFFYDQWEAAVFSKIANAEHNHFRAILTFIETNTQLEYTEEAPGEFQNEAFLNLYAELTADGAQSLEQALKVGALIEEIDIIDLQAYLTQTSNTDIILVFENLLAASRNHLRAFNNNLLGMGISYIPQRLDEETFNEIVSSPMEQGKKYKYQNRKGHGNKGNGGGTYNL